MNIDEQLFDRIEIYLKGKMPVSEAKAFEVKIAESKELADLVEMQRFEQEGMEYLVEKELRRKIENWEPPNPELPPNKKSISLNWKLFLGVFVFLSLITFGVLKMLSNQNVQEVEPQSTEEIKDSTPEQKPAVKKDDFPENEVQPSNREIVSKPSSPSSPNPTDPSEVKPKSQKNYMALAQSSYQLPDNLTDVSLRGGNQATGKSLLDQSFHFFDNKNWDDAITELSKIDASKNPDEFDVAQEYLAHAYFNAGDYLKAADYFQNFSQNDFIIDKDQMEWYLLLCYITQYDETSIRSKTDVLFKKILDTSNQHKFIRQAKALKAEIE